MATPPDPNKPLSLRREGEGLLIEWADGYRGLVAFRRLRDACPCAGCLEARAKPPDPLRVLSAREVAAGAPAPVAMSPRGHYAYQVVWNDGHDSGIYTLESLRRLTEQEPRPKG
jgi:DUF971 family protein